MNQADTHLQISEILRECNIPASTIEPYQVNGNITAYLIDGKYIMKVSTSLFNEQTKHDAIKPLALVPKIHHAGALTVSGQAHHYIIMDYVQGSDLWSAAQSLTDEEQYNIGKAIAQCLNELHSITDTCYDIGFYIPTIPRCRKPWKDGHIEYLGILQTGISKLELEPKNREVTARAFEYIHKNIDALAYQTGAKLLHNDFHPKNIIVHDGKLAGIIDWECSQYGEADFELSHLLHWCLYPEKYLVQENNLVILLKSVFEYMPAILSIPHLEKRFTIYQLEHELNQLIWNGKKQEEERADRMSGWLGGKIANFLDTLE